MYAPYLNLASRFFAPVAENAQLELEDQRDKGKGLVLQEPYIRIPL